MEFLKAIVDPNISLSYLFGNILLVSKSDLILILDVVIIGIFFSFYHIILAICLFFNLFGVFISFNFDLPSGPVIIVIAATTYFISILLHNVFKGRPVGLPV